MKSLIRLAVILFLSLLFYSTYAGGLSAKPFMAIQVNSRQLIWLDSQLSVTIAPSSGRICSCQILNLESANYDHRFVVLLAEKSNDGTGAAYKVAKDRIQKEKKQLKKMFYDKVQVVAEMQGQGSCKSLFYQLRTADNKLKLYEILNADIQ